MRKAGLAILELYEREFEVKEKKDKTLVTQADHLSEKIILEGLEGMFEDMAIISEERENKYSQRKGREWVFVVDPIDGTRDFVRKTGDFCIMIGLLHYNDPVFGAIYAPIKNEFYYAVKGKGAYLKDAKGNGEKLKVSSLENLSEWCMILSNISPAYAKNLVRERFGIVNIHKMGSLGLKLCHIAKGNAEFYINKSGEVGEWDICAPGIILEEAGGSMYTRRGKRHKFNKRRLSVDRWVIATNGKCKDEILKIVSRKS